MMGPEAKLAIKGTVPETTPAGEPANHTQETPPVTASSNGAAPAKS